MARNIVGCLAFVALMVFCSAQLSKYAIYTVNITSNVSLGLINVNWLTAHALKNQSGFWNTCKPYLIRLHDGLYQNSVAACDLIHNAPAGVATCTDNITNFLYRSGSGYCMSSKVCGASITIEFYKSADGKSLHWTWLPASVGKQLLALNYTKVGTCYGYTKLLNPTKQNVNMNSTDWDGFY